MNVNKPLFCALFTAVFDFDSLSPIAAPNESNAKQIKTVTLF